MRVALLGATSKTGRYVTAALAERGHEVIAIARSRERLDRLDPRARRAEGDLERPDTIARALEGAECVASLAHARFIPTLLDVLPPSCRRVVLTGSLRVATRLADPAAAAVRAGERAFAASGRAGVVLHPSMIYGAPDDRNVNRILRLLRRFPRRVPIPLPLPDGGRHTVQPVFVDDMVEAFVAAIERREADGTPIAVAGPEPITYRRMIELCAEALGRRVIVVAVPLGVLSRLAGALRRVGLPSPFDAAELARSVEDKSFDIRDLRERLGVEPRAFADGLKLKLARGWTSEPAVD
ncbi:MAG TPA: NAD(P)H-binding protein [Alphaproteobacteria bacterium]|jgi:nucleoside-diphosphate-sugar epimerase|nr:NAD(P)H-binding protein [Alphaproteobacteria bacterium]